MQSLVVKLETSGFMMKRVILIKQQFRFQITRKYYTPYLVIRVELKKAFYQTLSMIFSFALLCYCLAENKS